MGPCCWHISLGRLEWWCPEKQQARWPQLSLSLKWHITGSANGLSKKCFLANTGHRAPVGLVGEGSYTVQRKNCFDAPNFTANSNSQLQTFEHHSKSHLHFWAPLKRARSFGVSPTSIILAPAKSCMMRPEVTIGEIPSSINVPEGDGGQNTAHISLEKQLH